MWNWLTVGDFGQSHERSKIVGIDPSDVLDSRVRGNDESRGKNEPAAAPLFSFVVRELKFMTEFMVSYLTTTDWDTLLKSSASFTLQLE